MAAYEPPVGHIPRGSMFAALLIASQRLTDITTDMDKFRAPDNLPLIGRVHQAKQNLERAEFFAVQAARAQNASWAQIADELGMSKQAAWERYGKTPKS